MTVQDLINILELCDPNSKVTVWNSYRDDEDEDVHVSYNDDISNDPCIHIGNVVFGEEITLNADDSWPDPRTVSQEVIDMIKKSLDVNGELLREIYTAVKK